MICYLFTAVWPNTLYYDYNTKCYSVFGWARKTPRWRHFCYVRAFCNSEAFSIRRQKMIIQSWGSSKFIGPSTIDCDASLPSHYWQRRGTHTRHCAYHAHYRRLIPSNYNRTDRYLIGTDDRLARCTSHCKERIHSSLTSDQERPVAWRCHPQSLGGSANSDSNW